MEKAEVCSELQRVADDAKVTFGSLSLSSLLEAVVEGVEHRTVFRSFDNDAQPYFPLFEKLVEGNIKQTTWESYSPLSGFFGNYLVQITASGEHQEDENDVEGVSIGKRDRRRYRRALL
jgi:hypothetical protein